MAVSSAPCEGRLVDETILETRGLTKEFKGFVAVSDVNLRVRRGSIHALIGPNGAGKTTCFNLLTHFLEPTRGSIVYKGRDITGSGPAAIARIGLQRKRGASFDFWRTERLLEELNGRARALLESVGLAEFESAIAVELP